MTEALSQLNRERTGVFFVFVFQQVVLEQLDNHMYENEPQAIPRTTYTKLHEMDLRLYVKTKKVKILKENLL